MADRFNAIELDRRTIVLGAFSALPAACTKASHQSLRAADTHPKGYPTVDAVEFMGTRLAELSGGRLRIKMFSGGQMGAEKDTLEITIFGGLDFNRVNMAPLNSFVPETIVPSLPFMFRSIDHMRRAMDGAPGRLLLDALSAHGLIGLCFYDSGARSFYTTKRAIHHPDDLVGLKIRVQNSNLYVSMVEVLGGDATPMAFGEVYQGLLQGVVDGAENNWPSYESTRHFEAAQYYSLTRHVMAPEVLTMSARSWEQLSQADRNLVKTCAQESVHVMRQKWDARVQRSRAKVEAAGVTITTPDLAPFRDRVQPVWEDYLSTQKLRALANEIEQLA